jgi:hypothetical protein
MREHREKSRIPGKRSHREPCTSLKYMTALRVAHQEIPPGRSVEALFGNHEDNRRWRNFQQLACRKFLTLVPSLSPLSEAGCLGERTFSDWPTANAGVSIATLAAGQCTPKDRMMPTRHGHERIGKYLVRPVSTPDRPRLPYPPGDFPCVIGLGADDKNRW